MRFELDVCSRSAIGRCHSGFQAPSGALLFAVPRARDRVRSQMKAIDRVHRLPRIWSNNELERFAHLFRGDGPDHESRSPPTARTRSPSPDERPSPPGSAEATIPDAQVPEPARVSLYPRRLPSRRETNSPSDCQRRGQRHRWPVFRRPSMAGFGCPPRTSHRSRRGKARSSRTPIAPFASPSSRPNSGSQRQPAVASLAGMLPPACSPNYTKTRASTSRSPRQPCNTNAGSGPSRRDPAYPEFPMGF